MEKVKSPNMATRYKQAEEVLWSKLTKWQQKTITEDRKSDKNSHVLKDFIKNVIQLAESKEVLTTTKNK